MIKADLVRKVSESTKLSLSDGEVVVNRIFTALTDFLKRGEKLELRGFGTFGVKGVKAKVGRNMTTGEAVPLAPYTKPYFKPGRELKPWTGALEAAENSSPAIESGAQSGETELDPATLEKPAAAETMQEPSGAATEDREEKEPGA